MVLKWGFSCLMPSNSRGDRQPPKFVFVHAIHSSTLVLNFIPKQLLFIGNTVTTISCLHFTLKG